MHYFMSFLVLQSSRRGRESLLLCYYCLLDVLLLQIPCSSWVSLQFVIVVFPDHTHLLFMRNIHLHIHLDVMQKSFLP